MQITNLQCQIDRLGFQPFDVTCCKNFNFCSVLIEQSGCVAESVWSAKTVGVTLTNE